MVSEHGPQAPTPAFSSVAWDPPPLPSRPSQLLPPSKGHDPLLAQESHTAQDGTQQTRETFAEQAKRQRRGAGRAAHWEDKRSVCRGPAPPRGQRAERAGAPSFSAGPRSYRDVVVPLPCFPGRRQHAQDPGTARATLSEQGEKASCSPSPRPGHLASPHSPLPSLRPSGGGPALGTWPPRTPTSHPLPLPRGQLTHRFLGSLGVGSLPPPGHVTSHVAHLGNPDTPLEMARSTPPSPRSCGMPSRWWPTFGGTGSAHCPQRLFNSSVNASQRQ